MDSLPIIDLHSHSQKSDGRESVRQVFETAVRSEVSVLALTDHDTTSGWAEAYELAAELELGFVPGIEVTTRANVLGRDGHRHRFGVHMLAYLPNPQDTALLGALTTSVESRVGRLREIVDKIAKDYDLAWEDVEAELSEGATAGRPAVADALITRGHFTNRGEVFEKVFFHGGPYYVPNTGVPETIEAIELIRGAGGVPVIAHPLARGKGPAKGEPMPIDHFEQMIEAGLAGFEVMHRDVPEHARVWLRGLAEKHDLIITGSSDYHGEHGKPNRLGENSTSVEMLERILEQAKGAQAFLPKPLK
ncbi:MAG: PHP domain-containing protein [Actinomycetales bacterium]|nr:PHP domain-containing protein [Actinomycetales bacterium]